jgi:chemotaxis response regulator CheB
MARSNWPRSNARAAHTLPSIYSFERLREAYGKNAIVILLSGTRADATPGLGRIKEEGGIVIVQDPAEAEYPDMPRSAIDSVPGGSRVARD